MNDWVDAEEELTKELCFRGTEMTNDRELLEQAAKAAAYEIDFDGPVNGWYVNGYDENGDPAAWWNPLTDDGDALRLAVKLGMMLKVVSGYVVATVNGESCYEQLNPDPYAATRRAIVRAAAAIGEALSEQSLVLDDPHPPHRCCECAECLEYFKGRPCDDYAEPKCSDHPDAPHGFDRNASHSAGRYVCECEGWEPDVMDWLSKKPVAILYVTYGRDPEILATPNVEGFPEGEHELYAASVDAKAIRAEALEEAAKVCESKELRGIIAGMCAAAIRGLK